MTGLLLVSALGGFLVYDLCDLGNVALGKRWTDSSNAEGAPLNGTLTPGAAHLFFHTNAREQPWLELDLERPTQLSSAKIVNRDDYWRARSAARAGGELGSPRVA